MERVESSIAIGIRELFRIIIPGLLVVGYMSVEFPVLLSAWIGAGSIWYTLILGFVIGLIVYALQLYKWCWPWSRAHRKQINRLSREVKVALGGVLPSITKDYRAEYKQFLNTEADRSFAERVYYYTSFYYLLVEISQLFLLFALVEIALTIFTFPRFPATLPFEITGTYLWHLVGLALSIGGITLFHNFAKSQLAHSIDEQVMMVRVNRNAFESMQRSLKMENIENVLKSECDTMLKEIILDPDKRGYQIECDCIPIKDRRTGRDIDLYIIKIRTEYPLTIGGEPGGYKGFYKERLEAVLNHIVSLHQVEHQVAKVALEVVPTHVREDCLENLVPIERACNKGIITKNSPVYQVARRVGISHVLLRGRHLVGPNPGIVQVLEDICKKRTPQSVLELFAGTGVASRFLWSKGTPHIICVDNGPPLDVIKQLFEELDGVEYIMEDAFRFHICEAYDLIVADPYYEDALNFLKAKAQQINSNTATFVFVCGGVEHEYHRHQCKEIIRSSFALEPKEDCLYGQSILVCQKPM